MKDLKQQIAEAIAAAEQGDTEELASGAGSTGNVTNVTVHIGSITINNFLRDEGERQYGQVVTRHRDEGKKLLTRAMKKTEINGIGVYAVMDGDREARYYTDIGTNVFDTYDAALSHARAPKHF
jgi:phage terminase Nu1 subunit (DNA packaging protein)